MAKIKSVNCIRTRHSGMWTIVKIMTNQPGLYGIGSASDVNHPETVMQAIETIKPMLIGRSVDQIEDIWQCIHTSGYWRNGSILNTALGGIDVALWDIKGKVAGLPIYQLLGGKCRSAVPCYGHAGGSELPELEDSIRHFMEEGYQVIRCQLGGYGGGGFSPANQAPQPDPPWSIDRNVFSDEAYVEKIPQMFDYLRQKLGFDVKLTHDVHEHLRPQCAVQLSKLLEPYRLFFLEDVLPPEHIHWFRLIRDQCTTPQAMGELFTHPNEWMPLVTERLIDFVRVRVSKGAGITQCRKIATLCEWFGVHTAWQEGGDNDPVNQMAACHLDLASPSFGIQEENHFSSEELAAFPGHGIIKKGYLYTNDQPGLGIDIDEGQAKSLLNPDEASRPRHFIPDRRADGTTVRP